jgi:hypothetical protein
MLAACIEWKISLGDLIVGIGTLALAVVTWQLAKSSNRSLEALDLPFLLATPDRDRAFDFAPVFEEGEEPVGAEWMLSVELVNLGAGPAIMDGIDLADDQDGTELVKKDWEVDWLIKANQDAVTVGIPLKGEPPDQASLLTLHIYYRSASGVRYVTTHQIRVGKQQRAHRLTFKRGKA